MADIARFVIAESQIVSEGWNGVQQKDLLVFATSLSVAGAEARNLPALLLAKLRDVRSVMLAVPLVGEQQPVHGALAVFRMDENPRKMFGLQRAP